MGIVHYRVCPVCGSGNIQPVFAVNDYTVSRMQFQLLACGDCTLRFTQDVPDATEIPAYYKSENYISHSDTSKGLVNRLYKFVRKRTLRQKRLLLEKVTNKTAGKILDVGSGTGAFLHEMRVHGWEVTGLEPDDDAIRVARERYQLALQPTKKLFDLPEGNFDAITLWHVLEHVHSLHEYVEQLKKLLAEQGRLVVAVPNYTSFDQQAYKQFWAAYDVPRHLYHFSPKAMQSLLQQHGLSIIEHKPMWYDSFYVSLLSSKYRNGKTNWLTALWTGLVSDIKAMGDVKKCSSVIYIIAK